MSEQEEFEFRHRFEQERAKPPAADEPSLGARAAQTAGNVAAGLVRGAGSIGATVLAPIDAAARAVGIENSVIGRRDRRQAMDAGLQSMGAEPDSLAYQGGKLTGEIAGTAGAGGVLAQGVRAVSQAPRAVALASALQSGGFRAGTTPGAANMLTRIAGGAGAGGASAGLVDPEQAGMGAMIGGALPPALAAAAKVSGYAGRAVNSLAQPFTDKGQDAIRDNILRRFAEGGPTAINAGEIVPGSVPSLAEATGNAGLARLQSAARDIRPNAFVEREAANAAARNAAFEGAAGDVGQMQFFKASRDVAADDLYSKALNREPEALTPYIKGQVTQLLKRPSIDKASRTAQRWAIERGEKPSPTGSLRALHDVKTALDDEIGEAVRAGKGGEAKALQATKDKLLDVLEKLSPDYAEARATYAAMSQPVNAMEALQGLRITDAKGNITLANVQNALHGLEKQRGAPGVSAAKSVTPEQMQVLLNIRDDLLRQGNLAAGKSAGSNTFQNIATDNILATALPGKLGGMATGRVGDVAGQLGRLIYSGPNEKIRNKLVDAMLDPGALASSGALNPQTVQQLAAPNALNQLMAPALQSLYLGAPVVSTYR